MSSGITTMCVSSTAGTKRGCLGLNSLTSGVSAVGASAVLGSLRA